MGVPLYLSETSQGHRNLHIEEVQHSESFNRCWTSLVNPPPDLLWAKPTRRLSGKEAWEMQSVDSLAQKYTWMGRQKLRQNENDQRDVLVPGSVLSAFLYLMSQSPPKNPVVLA